MDNQRIKIVEVISDSQIGGGPRHVLGILKHIDKEKFDVILIAPRGWLTTQAAKIKNVGVRMAEFRSKFDFKALAKLKKDIAQFRASENPFESIIIHAHGPRAGYFCRLAVRPGERFVYTEHLWNEDFQLKNRLNSLLQLWGLKSIYRKANLVIAVSNSVKKFLNKKIIGDKDKVVVIPNAVEISADEPKIIHGPSHDKAGLLIGTIGALNRQKGQIYLIRAMQLIVQSLPKSKLEIIGEGPDKEVLEAEIKRLGLEAKIQLLGRREKVEKIINDWDLFILPSLSETFGLSLLEAMEAGIPLVATSVGGVPEIVKNGQTGVLVPPADSEQLAKAILWLLAEKKEREKLAKAAFSALKKRYDWSRIINIIEGEYQKLAR